MNNKCGCGCEQGFVPVSGNWDFNMNGNTCQRQNRCNTCEAETARKYTRQAEYSKGTACEKNGGTCRTEGCCERAERREEICATCGRVRNACICGQQACVQTAYDACEAENNAPACVMKTAFLCKFYMSTGKIRLTLGAIVLYTI